MNIKHEHVATIKGSHNLDSYKLYAREMDENSKVWWHVLILLFLLARTIRQCLVLQTKCIFYVSDPLPALLCRLLLLWILNYLGLARFVVA